MDVLCLVKNVVVQSQHQDLFREVIIGSGLFSIPLSNCLLEKTVFFFWKIIQAVVVRLLSCVQLFAILWTAAHQSSLSFTVSWSLLKFMFIKSVMPSNSHPLSSPSPPVFSLSQHQGLFQWASSSHQVAKVLAFQLQHQSFQWTLRTDLL